MRRGHYDGMMMVCVNKIAIDIKCCSIVVADKNAVLDYILYEVEYLDSETKFLIKNIITENLFYQVSEEGCTNLMIYEILDHRVSDDAVVKSGGYLLPSIS